MFRFPFRWFVGPLVLGVLLLAGCLPFFGSSSPASSQNRSLLNGERIYFTGTNLDGERIRYTGGPDFGGMMMGQFLTCASCHGVNARGGRHVMHMQVMDAPDIRIAALSAEAHHEEGAAGEGAAGEEDHDAAEGFAYTLEDFRRAVVEGRHPNGEPLDPNMPRWQLNERDLRDLYNFLASFPYP